jgi:RNA polymerase subunit RPABC4/transcription elongation factor Spt4
MDPIIEIDNLGNLFTYLAYFFGAFIFAFWISLVLWTYRDIRARTHDRLIQFLSSLIVFIFNLLGLLIYLLLRPQQTLDEAYQSTLEEEALLSEIETRKVCPGCGSVTDPEWQVCPHCHTRLAKDCKHCGRMMELPWQICPYCGTPVPGARAFIESSGLDSENMVDVRQFDETSLPPNRSSSSKVD